jgi:hypothetical protein
MATRWQPSLPTRIVEAKDPRVRQRNRVLDLEGNDRAEKGRGHPNEEAKIMLVLVYNSLCLEELIILQRREGIKVLLWRQRTRLFDE